MGDKVIIHWQIPPTSFPLADVRRSLPGIRRALNLGAVDHEHYADNCVEIDMIKECAGRWCVQSPLAQSSAAEKQHCAAMSVAKGQLPQYGACGHNSATFLTKA